MTNQRGFFLPGLPHPYFLLAVGIAIALSFGAGYWKGWSNGVQKFYDFKANVAAAQEQIRLEQERRAVETRRLYEAAQKGWANALADLERMRNRGPVIRVQPAKCPTGEMPSVPAAPTGVDGPTEEPRLGAEGTLTVEQCEQRVNLAIEDAAKVVHLQDFVRKQNLASQ